MLKAVLFVVLQRVVRLPGYGADFPHLHTDALEEGTDLSRAAPNTAQTFNIGLRFGNRARRMRAKIGLQGRLMRIEGTRLPRKVKLLEAFDTAILIQMQCGHDRLAGNATQARNLLVGQALTFQIDELHPLLHMGEGMVIAFIVEGINLGLRKGDLNHQVLNS